MKVCSLNFCIFEQTFFDSPKFRGERQDPLRQRRNSPPTNFDLKVALVYCGLLHNNQTVTAQGFAAGH